jgi:CheY-like chemotaxis protein
MSKSRTVLVVEDQDQVRAITVRGLIEEGYRVVQARDGLEALEVLKTETVDLVLTDVVMPNMDGFQLAAHLSAISKVPILLMTGYGEGHTVAAAPILFKPFSPTTLSAEVQRLLDSSSGHNIPSPGVP